MVVRHGSTPKTEHETGARGRRGAARRVALLAALPISVLLAASAVGVAGAGGAGASPLPSATTALAAQTFAQAKPAAGEPDFGPNVIVFDPSMSTAEIQAKIDAVTKQQVDNEMGDQRYSLLFKPGTYGSAAKPLIVQVGYYTEVAGLGQSPGDVTINGHVDVYNRCLGGDSGCIALDNFWRSLANLSINVMGLDGCRSSADFWAVSQAAPMRRVNLTGKNLSLMDYCTDGPQYASGGFIADSAFAGGTIINGSQQQFYTRNSNLDGWTNGVWNQVFSGDLNAPAQSFPKPPYTTLDTTPVSREKPYLYVDADGTYNVFVPAAQQNSRGITWDHGQTPGRSIPLSDFFVAHPSDSIAKINSALAQGKNLLVTPGVYDIDQSIAVKRADTVVLGMGLATLTALGGATPMTVADVQGVDIAGLTFDAGPVNSPVLLRIGSQHDKGGPHQASGENPTAVQDVFFRIGGPHVGKATASLEVNSDHAILDDVWAWRADHGAGVGWTVNTADTGVVVTGDDVTATGLFVEHYQKTEVIWSGERGRTVFFQNEMPYDAPDQQAWSHDGVDGYAAYKVADSVKTHQGWGMGSYIYTNVNPSLHSSRAFEVPVTPGVKMHDLLTISLNKAGTIDHVINDVGAPVTPDYQGPSNVVSYPAP